MSEQRMIGSEKRIALVAHDNKKPDLISWAITNKHKLSDHKLFATGTTGKMLEESLQLNVYKLFSGPLGGDQQVGAMIAEGKLDLIIFFWDPMQSQAHDSDVKALLRIAVAWNILIANNITTADFILSSPLMDSPYKITMPDYSNYLKRSI